MDREPRMGVDHAERWTAMLIAGELRRVLGLEPGDHDPPGGVLRLHRPGGGRDVVCYPRQGRVLVAGADYRLELTVLGEGEGVAIAYAGQYSPEAITGLDLLDWMHGHGHLPTDPNRLSAAQMGLLADLRPAAD